MSDDTETFYINLSLEGLSEKIRVVRFFDSGDARYKLYNDQDYIGTVWPECLEEGICWFSSDELSEDVMLKIGEAIEAATTKIK